MKGYRISLIRHGRTEANDKGIYIGRTDYPLSQKGISELYNKLDEFEYLLPSFLNFFCCCHDFLHFRRISEK